LAQKAYVSKNYTVEDFENSRQHWDAIQLDDGRMILGNSNAINLFDGVNWSFIHVPKGQTVYSLDISKTGRVYTGGEGDIGYLYPDSLNRMKFRSLLPKMDSLFQGFLYVRQTHYLDNKVYFRSKSQLMMYDEVRDTVYVHQKKTEIGNSFLIDDEIIVQLNKGIYKINNLNEVLIDSSEAFREDEIYGMLPIDGQLLIYFRNKGLQVFNGYQLESFSTSSERYLETHLGYRMLKLNNDQIAVATLTGGIVILNLEGKIDQILTKERGLNDSHVYGLFVDKQDLLWAMLDDGISVLHSEKGLQVYDNNYGIEGLVTGIYHSNKFTHVITNKGFYIKDKGEEFRKININPVQVYNSVKLSDKIYSATFEGLFQINNDDLNQISSTVFEKIITVNDSSLLGWSKEKLYLININNEDFEENLFIEDFKYPINWIINDNYLFAYEGNNKIAKLSLSDKEKTIIPISDDVGNIYIMNSIKDTILLGTSDSIYKLEGDQVKKIDQKPLQNFKSVTQMEYCNKAIWLRSEAELFKIDYENNNQIVQKDIFNTIGNTEGVYSISCTENQTWFGLENKVISISNEYDVTHKPFYTNITRLVVNNDSLIYAGFGEPEKTTLLNYSKQEIRFNYAAANFFNPEQNVYSYKLEGFDNKWSSWSSNTQKAYTNIPEGDYIFKVRSKNIFNKEGIPDEFKFKILPPWYRTWWAYSLYVILFCGFLYMIYKIRLNQILKVQRVRNRIADDLHDDLSGTLIGISNFAKAITKNPDMENQKRFIGLIEKSADEAKEKISDIVWTINPTHDEWTNFLTKCRRHASDIFEAQGIEYALEMDENIPGNLEMELRKNLWLIFKEIITNIIKHAEAEYVLIRFTTESGKLNITIRDKGKGFDVNTQKTGNGINNVKKRVETINGKLNLDSTPSEGTKWNIVVPV